MDTYDALRVEGTSSYLLLVYSVISKPASEKAPDEREEFEGWNSFLLDEDSWPYAVLLLETTVNAKLDVLPKLLSGIHLGCTQPRNRTVFCMFDGAFSGYEDIYGANIADQIYAFANSADYPVIAMESAVRDSGCWREVIDAQRRLLIL